MAMSILAQVELTASQALLAAVVLFGGPLVSVLIGRSVGIFRSPGILGPERVDAREPVVRLMGILLMGIFTYIAIPSFYFHSQRPSPAPSPNTAPTTLQTQPSTSALKLSGRELVMLNAMGGTGALAVMLLTNVLLRPGGLTRLGFHPRGLRKGLVSGVAGTFFVLPLMVWVGLATAKFWELFSIEHPQKHEMLELLDQAADPALRWLIVISAVVLAPLYEEVLFRGHLQTALTAIFSRSFRPRSGPPPLPTIGAENPPLEPSNPGTVQTPPQTLDDAPPLKPRFSEDERRVALARWASVMIASLAFAAVHPWWTIPPIFFLSVCLGFAYERSGNLFTPIVMHALFNGTSVLLSRHLPQ